MKRIFTLLILMTMLHAVVQAQDKYNLDPTDASRFTVTDKVWPQNVGEGDVCLWNDDKLAAFTITIDDNNEGDIDFWKSMMNKYGFNFTWFVITEAPEDQYNVQDWSKFQDVAALGSQVNGHDDRNWWNTPPAGETNPTPEEYYARLKRTQDTVNAHVTNGKNRCLTYAYPFGEGNADEARKLFIAIRGTNGVLNLADKVNYLDVNSISNPYIYADQASRDKYVLPLLDKTSTLYGVNYYRGWGSTHFHHVDAAAQTTTDEFLQYLTDKQDLWIDGFTRVSQYSQSYATHQLSMDEVNAASIKFTLTDQMQDDAYDFPLTVKIRVDNTWVNAKAVQNGNTIDAKIITYNGNKFALVKAVPDRGQVTLTGVSDSDPAVITPKMEDQTMSEKEILKIDFSAKTNGGDAITFSVANLPAFGTFTDNGDNTGSIVFAPLIYDAGTYRDITIIADNGRSTTTDAFDLVVNPNVNTVIIKSSKEDAAVYFPEHSFVDPNNRPNAIAGGGYVDGKQMSPVFPFLLPEIPEGKVIKSAKFSVNLESFVNPDLITGKLDLYGLPVRNAAKVLVTDGYAGPFDQDANAMGLQDDFADKNTPQGVVETNTTGIQKLVDYLNEQYKTAVKGDYVFIRISNDDVNQNQYGRTMFTTADGAEANGLPYPTLFIEFEDDDTAAVDDVDKETLGIYPNPVTDGRLKISLDGFKDNVQLKVYSITGKEVFNRQLKTSGKGFAEIQMDLNPGIYVVKLFNGDSARTRKLIVQ